MNQMVVPDIASARMIPPPLTLKQKPAAAPATAPFHPPIDISALIGRPDLSEADLLAAIAERLTFEKRDPSQARTVLKAAQAGKQIAVTFVRKLVLPLPQAPLEMPIQAILAEAAGAEKPAGKRRFLSWTW